MKSIETIVVVRGPARLLFPLFCELTHSSFAHQSQAWRRGALLVLPNALTTNEFANRLDGAH